jgi:uncharacterized delta-60 repeat protein
MIDRLERRRLLAFPAQDLTFGRLGFAARGPEQAHLFAPLADGKFFIEGQGQVVIYNADGSMQTSRRLTEGTDDGVVLRNGNVLFGGQSRFASNSLRLTEMRPDGTLNDSFGKAGKARVNAADAELTLGTSVIELPDGSIAVIWSFSEHPSGKLHTVVYKVSPTGGIDTTFGDKGRVELVPGTHLFAAADRDSGSLFVVGITTGSGENFNDGTPYIIRVLPSGEIDGSFFSRVRNTGGIGEPTTLAVQKDGKVLLVTADFQGGIIYRLNPDGHLDSTFGVHGQVSRSVDGLETIPDIEIDSAGKIVVFWRHQFSAAESDEITRYNPDGALDTTFGDAGVYTGPPQMSGSLGMHTLPDGSLLIATYDTAPGTALRLDDSPDVRLVGSRLFVRGTRDNDTITLAASGTSAVLTYNGVQSIFPLADMTAVSIDAAVGDDSVTCSIDIPAFVHGGQGADTITTAGGNDEIDSGLRIFVAPDGSNVIHSGGGNDVIHLTDKGSSIDAGDGNDSITGDASEDTIIAGSGDDLIEVGFTDSISAGDGNDWVAGFGNKLISGGEGNDSLSGNSTGDPVQINGDNGDDALNFSNPDQSSSEVVITLRGGAGDDVLAASDGSYALLGGADNDTIHAATRNDFDAGLDHATLDGGDGNDRLFDAAGSDSFIGGAGNDRIYAAGDLDSISAGGGNDVIFIGAIGVTEHDSGGATVSCGAGNDTVYSQPQSFNTIAGGLGNDRIIGYLVNGADGDDTLTSDGAELATLTGGIGDDTFFARDNTAATLNGGAGNDTATADPSPTDLLISIEHVV